MSNRVGQVVGFVEIVKSDINSVIVDSGCYSYPCSCEVGTDLVKASC